MSKYKRRYNEMVNEYNKLTETVAMLQKKMNEYHQMESVLGTVEPGYLAKILSKMAPVDSTMKKSVSLNKEKDQLTSTKSLL